MGEINSGQLFNGKVGVAFSQTPAFTGTISAWQGNNLPTGLNLNPTTGLISGEPFSKGNFNSVISTPQQFSKITSGADIALAVRSSDSRVLGWNYNSSSITPEIINPLSISGGAFHFLSLSTIQRVTSWGDNTWGQATVPSGLADVFAISAGENHSLALVLGGYVVGWGRNNTGQAIPPSGLSGVLAISAGSSYSLAIKSDRTVVGWGWDMQPISPPVGLSDVVAIKAGNGCAFAVKSDSSVVAWGNTSQFDSAFPSGLSGVSSIETVLTWPAHFLALKTNGTVVAWGHNNYGQCNVPAGLSGVISIACGQDYSMALKSDGELVVWGRLNAGNIPKKQTTISFAISEGAPLIAAGQTGIGTTDRVFSKTFSLTNSANRSATNWSASSLPPGLSINTTTGEITGTPTNNGIYTTTLTATGIGGSGTETASITISPIFVGRSRPFSFYAGSTPAASVYYGSKKIWPDSL